MKKILRWVTLFAAIAVSPTLAGAQGKAPVGDIEITIGSGAGGTPDLMMRRLAKALNETKIVEQPIIIANRPGGAWTVAANHVLKQTGNDNLMITINQSIFTTPIVQNLPNTYEKITPLAMLLRMNFVVLERVNGPDNNLAELAARAKSGGDRSVTFGGANVGSTDHIIASLLGKAGGFQFNYVPFDAGGGPLMAAFLGGSVEVMALTLDEAYPLVEGGKAKILGVLSENRVELPAFKDVPTAREQNLDVVWTSWYGIAGAPGMSPEVVAWWDDKFSRVVKSDPWKKMIDENFLETAYLPSSEMPPVLDGLYQKFLAVLRELKLAKK